MSRRSQRQRNGRFLGNMQVLVLLLQLFENVLEYRQAIFFANPANRL